MPGVAPHESDYVSHVKIPKEANWANYSYSSECLMPRLAGECCICYCCKCPGHGSMAPLAIVSTLHASAAVDSLYSHKIIRLGRSKDKTTASLSKSRVKEILKSNGSESLILFRSKRLHWFLSEDRWYLCLDLTPNCLISSLSVNRAIMPTITRPRPYVRWWTELYLTPRDR